MAKVMGTIASAVKHWYLPLIVGILFAILGVYIFFVPLEAYIGLSILFSISFIVSGLLEIFFSIQNRDELDSWGWYLASGILGTVIGVLLLVYPSTSMAVLPFVVGFVLLFRSLQLLGVAFDLRRFNVVRWGDLALVSVILIVLSILLLLNPVFTGLSLVVLTALGFIVLGISLCIFAFDLKKFKDLPKRAKAKIEEMLED